MEKIARGQSVQSLAQKDGLRSRAPAISGQEQIKRRPGRRPNSFVGMRVVNFLLSPQSPSMITSWRRKNEDIPLICRFGWEVQIESRRVFGSGPIAVFSKTKNSQRGQRGRQAIMEAISIVWSSGWLGTTPIVRRKATLSAQSHCVLQVNFSSVLLTKKKKKQCSYDKVYHCCVLLKVEPVQCQTELHPIFHFKECMPTTAVESKNWKKV